MSGVYITIDALPDWMRDIGALFPIKWAAQDFRSVFLPDSMVVREAAGSWELGKTALMLGVWSVLGLVLCLLTFRWTNNRAGEPDRGAGARGRTDPGRARHGLARQRRPPPALPVRRGDRDERAQESLTNARKHSHATGVTITLRVNESCVALEVRDNGVGFDPDAPVHGFGLRGMRNRAARVGGRLTVHSGEHGTAVELEVPR